MWQQSQDGVIFRFLIEIAPSCEEPGPSSHTVQRLKHLMWAGQQVTHGSIGCSQPGAAHPLCLGLHHVVFAGRICHSFTRRSMFRSSLVGIVSHKPSREKNIWQQNRLQYPIMVYLPSSNHIGGCSSGILYTTVQSNQHDMFSCLLWMHFVVWMRWLNWPCRVERLSC